MSDYERHRGTIERVHFDGDLEAFAESLGLGDLPGYYDGWEEYFRDNVKDYVVYKGDIFKVNNIEEDSSDDIFEYKMNGNKIEYQFSFYNGGTCLYENIIEVLEKVELEDLEEDSGDFVFKDDIESVSYSDDFWYALTNGYIDLDEILVDNKAKAELIRAINIVESFQGELESSDFFEEM